jgi:hypothetical protein
MSLGGDPHDLLASTEQVPLQSPGQMPAVFDRPAPLGAEPRHPHQQVQMVGRRGADGAFTKLAATLVDGDNRVGALVRVDPQDHHSRVSSHRCGRGTGPVGGPPQ